MNGTLLKSIQGLNFDIFTIATFPWISIIALWASLDLWWYLHISPNCFTDFLYNKCFMFIQFISPLQMENLLHNSITNTNYSNLISIIIINLLSLKVLFRVSCWHETQNNRNSTLTLHILYLSMYQFFIHFESVHI